MPLYQLSRTHANSEIEKLEAKGERVTFVTPDGPVLIVVTETRPRHWGLETRPAETRA